MDRYTQDIFDLYEPAQSVELIGATGEVPELPWLQEPAQEMPAPQNLSARIQEFLGAKEPDQGGMAMDILSGRFNAGSDIGGYGQGIVNSALGKPQVASGNDVMKRLAEIATLQKALSGGDTPSNVREYQYYTQLTPEQQQEFLRVKRATQLMNLGGSVAAFDPLTGGIASQFEKTLPPSDQPANAAAKKSAETRADLDAKSDSAATSTLPIIDQLRTFNTGTFEMPYADTAPVRGYTRVFGDNKQQEMQTNMDLLKQARTDLAAPLAKELGVNPTDRDFQATLDRIFDSNASKESREAQINALEQRILARKNARAGAAPANVQPPTQGGTTNWVMQNGKLVPAP